MTSPAARRSRRWLSSATALALTGCASVLGLGQAPHLYRVTPTPTSTYQATLAHSAVQLLVDVPSAPAGLDTSQIALSRSAVSIDYFADSAWTDRVPLLVQTALLESFENSKAITAIDRESVGLRADLILRTDIRHFEAVYDSRDGPPEVWIAISARLVEPSGRDVVAHASFESRKQAQESDIPQIVLAFDEVLGAVMEDIVVWTVRNPALSAKRRPL
jgi:cholesterol transport system auxiliary component